MDLTAYPRVRLAHLPTAIEAMPRLSEALGGPQILIKRDDCTGLSTGGNKTRKLEYLIGEALAHDADIVLTHGATQSNHVRQTAAAAARHGLECHVLLENRTGSTDPNYLHNGNVLLTQIHGASVEHVAPQADMNGYLEEVAGRMRGQGRRPYAIPGGGSNPVGALGYVNCALELTQQFIERDIACRHVVLGSGSGGTHAGFLAGLAAISSQIEVHGVCVRQPRAQQEAAILSLSNRVTEWMGTPSIRPEHVETDDNHIGEGYGLAGEDTLEAIALTAKLEGVLLDPVYTGKAMAGLIAQIRAGRYARTDTVLFLHTGGAAALPGYVETIRSTLDAAAPPVRPSSNN